MKTFFLLIIMATVLLTSCNKTIKNQHNNDFNEGWRFLEDSTIDASAAKFDDSAWRSIDLPHDWSVEDYQEQDSVHIGPFNKSMKNGNDVGYLRGGVGWYRKSFKTDTTSVWQNVYLHFDGVQTEMTLWVNGKEVGTHDYGYSPFYFDITPYLNPAGKMNELAVKVVNPEQNSRWFAGAGIFRQVNLSVLNPIHIGVWGIQVQTPKVSEENASVKINAFINNRTNKKVKVKCITEIVSPSGVVVKTNKHSETIHANGQSILTVKEELSKPQLWNTENPDLYTARITVIKKGVTVDKFSTTFGIRSIKYSAEEGFLLNGKPVLLKGGCMHHDNGLLGSATFKDAEERRVRLMKENGFNAIRTSHNPPSAAFLDVCDKLGMLVIDEFTDMWEKPKRPNDYSNHFKDSWEKDLESYILRDINHPCVVMWSYGNEIPERALASGLIIGEKLIRKIKSLDSSRPVTQAICSFWDNEGLSWEDTAPAFEIMDIGGYNYQWQRYESDHEKYPERLMIGTESVPKEALENWQMVERHPYVIGDFVWTGMDYIGETGIGHSSYNNIGDNSEHFAQPWPWYISWCGDIDIIGNKKPQMYYRDVVWGNSNLELAVHEPVPAEKHEMVFYWGWPLEYQSWNWTGHEGETFKVNVYSSYPKVKLMLNGENIGEQSIPDSSITATFEVPYKEGKLTATGIDEEGNEVEQKVLQTTGRASSLQLVAENKSVKADRGNLMYIRVLANDDNELIVPVDSSVITITVDGPAELLAAGNAKPLAQGSMQDNQFSLFEGRGLIILRSTGKKGTIKVTANSDGLPGENLELKAN